MSFLGIVLNLTSLIAGILITLAGNFSQKIMTIVAAVWPAVGAAVWILQILPDEGLMLSLVFPGFVVLTLFCILTYVFHRKPYIAPAILLGASFFIATALGCCAVGSSMAGYFALVPTLCGIFIGAVHAKCSQPASSEPIRPSCLPTFLDVIASLVGSLFVVTCLIYLIRSDHQSIISVVQDRLLSREQSCPNRESSVISLSVWAVTFLFFLFAVRRRHTIDKIFKRTFYRTSLIDEAAPQVVSGCPVVAKVLPHSYGQRDG